MTSESIGFTHMWVATLIKSMLLAALIYVTCTSISSATSTGAISNRTPFIIEVVNGSVYTECNINIVPAGVPGWRNLHAVINGNKVGLGGGFQFTLGLNSDNIFSLTPDGICGVGLRYDIQVQLPDDGTVTLQNGAYSYNPAVGGWSVGAGSSTLYYGKCGFSITKSGNSLVISGGDTCR